MLWLKARHVSSNPLRPAVKEHEEQPKPSGHFNNQSKQSQGTCILCTSVSSLFSIQNRWNF